jgi:hypothetical protein
MPKRRTWAKSRTDQGRSPLEKMTCARSRPFYQLTDPRGRNHTAWVFYAASGIDAEGDPPLSVVVTVRKMPLDEMDVQNKAIAAVHKSTDDVVQRPLEFFRYVVMRDINPYTGQKRTRAVDLDATPTMQWVDWEGCGRTTKEMCKVPLLGQVETLPRVRPHQPRAPHNVDALPSVQCNVNVYGHTGEHIRVVMSTYKDPDVRTGVAIVPVSPTEVRADTAWGACVRAVGQRHVLLRRLGDVPRGMTRSDVQRLNTSPSLYEEARHVRTVERRNGMEEGTPVWGYLQLRGKCRKNTQNTQNTNRG